MTSGGISAVRDASGPDPAHTLKTSDCESATS
jgi:hypothetical protein